MASGLFGLTGGGVVDRVSQGAGDSAVVVAGSDDRLAHDQVAGQFHPDDDVGAAGSAAVVHDEGQQSERFLSRGAEDEQRLFAAYFVPPCADLVWPGAVDAATCSLEGVESLPLGQRRERDAR